MRSLARETAATTVVVLLLLLTACTGGETTKEPSPSPSAGSTSDGPALGRDESLREEALALVEAREDALVAGDREAFLATVDPEAEEFAKTQARWFDNLAELPVTDVTLALGDESVMIRISGEGDLQLPVDFTMRLKGFDRRPVTRRMIWTMVRRDGEVVLSNDRNVRIEGLTEWTPDPWDLTDIEVRRSGGILAIFDEKTVADADQVMAALADAADVVRPHVPRWSGRFVAYDISDLQAMDQMSAMEAEDTAGIAFGVGSAGRGRPAAFRFMVNPAHVGDPISRGIVFRHELVHVAVGGTDSAAPTWLREGTAEYVARSAFPLEQRRRVSVQEVGDVRPRPLEPSHRFYTRSATTNYQLALVCDHLATTRGEEVLWDLVATFRTARVVVRTDAERIVRRELGSSTRDLVASAQAWAAAG